MKQTARLSRQSLLSVSLLQLLFTHFCKGESQLIGPPHSVVAAVGDDVILPCHLKPVMDLTAETLEWKRFDLSQRFVHVLRDGQNLEHVKNPSYRGRTSLFTDELKRGNISLKLSKVQLSDRGIYHCDIPELGKQSSVKLVVPSGAVSPPAISLAGIDRERGGVILNCESKSWHPEPEVLWLDGEGKLLSAGPTETVRGPDDLYTVSSRVTVEKRHSNSFTCRVQQRNINQTRETHVQVPDDFFKVQSSSSSIITGLAVSLAAVCILFLLFLLFFAWKWRQTIIKTERHHRVETEEEGRRNHSETNRTDYHHAAAEEMKPLEGKEEKKSKHSKWPLVSRQRFQEEQQRREQAENKLQDEHARREEAERQVQRREQELQKKTQELQQLKVTAQSEVKDLKNQLETQRRQFEGNQDVNIRPLQLETQGKDKAQSEVQPVKNQLETKEEVNMLQEEKKRMKLDEGVKTFKELELKKNKLEKNKPEPEISKTQPQQQNSNCLIS